MSTDASWLAHVGRCVEEARSVGFRYGPKSKTSWSLLDGRHVLHVGQNWHRKLRRPTPAFLRELGESEEQFFAHPVSPAATCSPFVAIFFELLLGYEGNDRHVWGQSTRKILGHRLVKGAVVTPPKTGRSYSFADLPHPLPAPLCICTYYSHVVLLIDCDVIPVRNHGGTRYQGLWVLAADGSLERYGKNLETGRIERWKNWMADRGWPLARVDYSGKGLVWERASERGARQAGYSDKGRLISIRGILEPTEYRAGGILAVKA